MKNLTLLGSTGSIGRQTLEVAAANPDRLRIRALAAHSNVDVMLSQIRQCKPDLAVLTDQAAAEELRRRYDGKTEILAGEEGLLAAATYEETDTVLGAMVGYAGLEPTLAAIESGKDIALANKETLVAAGHLVMEAVAENHVRLTPVDSEHSAIFQSLRGGTHDEVKRLILTASGGPFLHLSKEELAHVTVEQSLHHPNWNMGRKVTVDSSTLANKGLEVMEAHWLSRCRTARSTSSSIPRVSSIPLWNSATARSSRSWAYPTCACLSSMPCPSPNGTGAPLTSWTWSRRAP